MPIFVIKSAGVLKPDRLVRVYHPSSLETKVGDCDFKAPLGYGVKCRLQKPKRTCHKQKQISERRSCGALTGHRGFIPSQDASGLFACLPFLVLECNLSQVTVADKCRMILFIGSFLKLMGKVGEAEKLFLSVEDMLLQVE